MWGDPELEEEKIEHDVFWMCFMEKTWFEVDWFLVKQWFIFGFFWGNNANYCEQNWPCPVFHEKNICSSTRISRTCFSRLPPNISILHVFVGKIPCHCETQPPTTLQQNMVQVTSSEFAHQCHSTSSHSQDVNGTSRKCSPLYLENKKCEQCPKKTLGGGKCQVLS